MAIVTSVLDVFGAVGEWILTQLPLFMALFWTPASSGDGGSLTILGVVTLMSLAVGVSFLLVGVIQNFFKWRS